MRSKQSELVERLTRIAGKEMSLFCQKKSGDELLVNFGGIGPLYPRWTGWERRHWSYSCAAVPSAAPTATIMPFRPARAKSNFMLWHPG